MVDSSKKHLIRRRKDTQCLQLKNIINFQMVIIVIKLGCPVYTEVSRLTVRLYCESNYSQFKER